MKKNVIFVIGVLAVSLISCTRSAVVKNGSDVVIKIPNSQSFQSNISQSYIEKILTKNNLQALSSTSSSTGFSGARPLNCFAVLVSGPIDALKRNHCYKKISTGAAIDFRSGGLSTIVGYGSNIELNDLESGPDRVFRLLGFHSSNGQCGSLESNHDNYGNPYIVSEIGGVKLEPGTVSITMPMTFVDDRFFDRCEGPDFPQDHNNDNSGGAKKLAIQKNYFPLNQIVESSCQSVDVVAQNESGYQSSLASAASFQLMVNGVVTSTFNSFEDCSNGVNSGAVTIAALQDRKNVWFMAPNKGAVSVVAFNLSFSSNPDSLSVVPLTNVIVRSYYEMSIDITAPQRVLSENCYAFSMDAKYMDGSQNSGFYSSATVTADNANLYSDSNCTSVTSSVSFSNGKSLVSYFKSSSPAGTEIKIYADVSGWVTAFKTIEVGQGSATASQMEIQYNNQTTIGDCVRARVIFLNEEHSAVPLASAVTLNLSAAGTTAKYTDDSYCMSSNGGTHTVPAGQSSAEFYFEPLTFGNSSLSISGGSLAPFVLNYFAKYRYKLAIINQGASVLDSGTCTRFDIHTQYQNSSPAYLSGTTVSVASAFAMFSDANCTLALGSAFVPSSSYYTSVFFLVDNLGSAMSNSVINVSGSMIQSGSVGLSVNPRPVLQTSWGLSSYKIPSEYALDLKLFSIPFTGVGPFNYVKSSGTGTLSGDSYTSTSGDTATLTITDAKSNMIVASTQTVSRSFVSDFMTSLPSGYTFGRSSSATFYDGAGTLVSAASATPRFDHNSDPASGHSSVGLLIEPARINHTVYSSNLSAGNWAKSYTNVTTSSVVQDPTGTNYSTVLEWASPTYTNMAYASSQPITPTAYTTYAGSVFVKKDTARFVGLKVHEYGGSYGYSGVVLDLDSGNVVGMIDPWSGDVSANFGVQKLKNGWFRIWTNYLAKGGTGIHLYLYPVYHGGTTLSPIRDNTIMGRTYFWGAQLEVGESMTSYIATGASAAARSADTLVGSLSTVSTPFLSTTESTVRLIYGIPEGGVQSDGTIMQMCGSGCSGEQLMVNQATNGMLNLSELSSGGTQNQTFYTPAFSVRKGLNILSVSLATSSSYGFNWGFNGVFNTSGTSYPSYHPSYSSGVLYLGNANGGVGQPTVHIRKLEGWTHSLSVPALRSMSQ